MVVQLKPAPTRFIAEGIQAVIDLIHPGDAGPWARFEAAARDEDSAERIAELVRRHQLSSFDLKCLLATLAVWADSTMVDVLASSGASVFSRRLTVRYLVHTFCSDPDERLTAQRRFAWSAPLMRERLIRLGDAEVGSSGGVLPLNVTVAASTATYLLHQDDLPDALAKLAQTAESRVNLLNVILPEDQVAQVREMVQHHEEFRETIKEWGLDKILPYGRGLTLLFSGPSGTGKTLFAHGLASHIKRPMITVAAADFPEDKGLETLLSDLFAVAAKREAVVVMDECEALLGKGDKRKATTFRAIESFDGILILTTNHPERLDEALERRIIYHLPFEIPSPEQRALIWGVHLPPNRKVNEDIDIEALANTYDFSGGTIKNAVLVAINRSLARRQELLMAHLEEGCKSQLRYALEDLTVRTTTHLRMSDIVLPEESHKKVNEIIQAVRNQSKVLNAWGFGKKLVTGKGITVLFDGPPGTGKTLCAEIIAGEFDRALYRVNIPEVVSKWVGETEKHIKAIFQQARISHAMLLFDEADSLFSARTTETQTATDRYANMEVNLLLQEIERFPGICILTTNFYGSLDRALIRRIQFRVTFEEPPPEQRTKIWETLFPKEAPLAEDVNFAELGKKYELTGGMIKNAVLRAAYRAADEGDLITQTVLHDACRDEYVAAGKVTRDASAIDDKKPRIHRGLEEEAEFQEQAAAESEAAEAETEAAAVAEEGDDGAPSGERAAGA